MLFCYFQYDLISQVYERSKSNAHIRNNYINYFLPPFALDIYTNASVLYMSCADLGTMAGLLMQLATKKVAYSIEEQEFVALMCSFQVCIKYDL